MWGEEILKSRTEVHMAAIFYSLWNRTETRLMANTLWSLPRSISHKMGERAANLFTSRHGFH